MPGWGERKDRGTGTTSEIEIAHEAMDKLGIPGGNLAERCLTLIGRRQHELDCAATPLMADVMRERDAATAAVARVREYCQNALAIFVERGFTSPPAIGVADVLGMLEGALDG